LLIATPLGGKVGDFVGGKPLFPRQPGGLEIPTFSPQSEGLETPHIQGGEDIPVFTGDAVVPKESVDSEVVDPSKMGVRDAVLKMLAERPGLDDEEARNALNLARERCSEPGFSAKDMDLLSYRFDPTVNRFTRNFSFFSNETGKWCSIHVNGKMFGDVSPSVQLSESVRGVDERSGIYPLPAWKVDSEEVVRKFFDSGGESVFQRVLDRGERAELYAELSYSPGYAIPTWGVGVTAIGETRSFVEDSIIFNALTGVRIR